eukprot:CAMPEP_0195260172 /NCGR_PEP_ID=MMETSP0706-20130129/8423_1 /TAXON_ID=33640 /ORGANISM="Asterionellopsis glacialis, Strain CCMP134" /LENGTH=187 /DNA_ID=CAMNT_0040313855 /DNA_START=111 /DNA_END=674 /DNA_ORIENTATION=-
MYRDVKQAFIKLALQHHPDTAPKTSSSSSASEVQQSKKSTTELFFQIRHAFESIRADDQGKAILVKEEYTTTTTTPRGFQEGTEYRWSDEEMTAWFHQETGHRLSFYMDDLTRHEVIQVSKTMSRGGLDKGGMWEMAASLEREEQVRNERHQDAGGRPSPPKVLLQVTEGHDSTKRHRRARRRSRGR